jgi:hypothetical protein
MWYDGIGRQVATANLGALSSAPTRSGAPLNPMFTPDDPEHPGDVTYYFQLRAVPNRRYVALYGQHG